MSRLPVVAYLEVPRLAIGAAVAAVGGGGVSGKNRSSVGSAGPSHPNSGKNRSSVGSAGPSHPNSRKADQKPFSRRGSAHSGQNAPLDRFESRRSDVSNVSWFVGVRRVFSRMPTPRGPAPPLLAR